MEPLGVSSYLLLCSSQLFILKCWAECNLIHSRSERPWNFLATFLALQRSPGSELFPSDASVIFIPVSIPWSQWKHSWGTETLPSPCCLKVVTGHNFTPTLCCSPEPINLYSNQIILISLSHIFYDATFSIYHIFCVHSVLSWSYSVSFFLLLNFFKWEFELKISLEQ